MKTCLRKTDEALWELPLSKRTPPPLSTNLPISELFFHKLPLCPNFKNKNPPPPPNFRGEGGNYVEVDCELLTLPTLFI